MASFPSRTSLAHTVDAARSWSEIKPGLGAVEQVQFLSLGTKGFVLSHEGLFSSSNAGLTWKRSGSTSPALTWISFSTVKDGWGVADDSLWKTANAGASWKRFATPIQPTVACFVSAGTGWILWHIDFETVASHLEDCRWRENLVAKRAYRVTIAREWPTSLQGVGSLCAAPTTIWALVVPTGAGYAGGEMYGVYGSSNGGKSWRLAGVNPPNQGFLLHRRPNPKDSRLPKTPRRCSSLPVAEVATTSVQRPSE